MLWSLLACLTASPPPPLASEVAPEAHVPTPAPPEPPQPEPLPDGPFFRELAPGLTVAAYAPPPIPDPGFSKPEASQLVNTDRRLFVVTIDPALFELRYFSALQPELGVGAMRADDWAHRFGLSVVFNPGMFEPNGAATGYTRSGDFVSQPQFRRQSMYRSWLVVGPGPNVEMLDQVPTKGPGKYGDMTELPAALQTRLATADMVSQSLHIVRDGHAVYPPRNNQWSELAYGVDQRGHLVVVFSRYPYEMREFGARVAALELGIVALLHGEGGPEASLVVRAGGVELIQVGSYETTFYDDRNDHLWALPAVMGAVAR